MTDTTPDPLDALVLPEDQRFAADLALACVDEFGEKVGELLADLLDLPRERTLAVLAVQSRNLAAVLVAVHGQDKARRMLESTRWDAAVAEVEDDDH